MSALYNIQERLDKLIPLIPDPQYAVLFQGMRNDIKIAMSTLERAVELSPGHANDIMDHADAMERQFYVLDLPKPAEPMPGGDAA